MTGLMTERALNQTLTLVDGRVVGFADYGDASQIAVFHCHGAPGSRLQPNSQAAQARDNGFRVIGVDRPAYGLSSPLPGRSIADSACDILSVADHLGIDQFMIVGASTGGAYALALAALAPRRVLNVVLCCALADMRWAHIQAPIPGCDAIWDAPDRTAALAQATASWGDDGSGLVDVSALPPADIAFITNPALAAFLPDVEAFRQGMQGIVDDRIADGPIVGWGSFDVSNVTCPVTIIHGLLDTIVPVAHAGHIASLLPQSDLQIFESDGHLSINDHIVPTLRLNVTQS
jgi:pimeloyl-ACP methyl ester carboxylesterase